MNRTVLPVQMFYQQFEPLKQINAGSYGEIFDLEPKCNALDASNNSHAPHSRPPPLPDYDLVVKRVTVSDKAKRNKLIHQFDLTKKLGLLNHHSIYYDRKNNELLSVTEKLCMDLDEYITQHHHKFIQHDLVEHEAKKVAAGIVLDLFRLHRLKLLHCDINPFNIMIGNDGRWRLIDYDLMLPAHTKSKWRGTIGWVNPNLDPVNTENVYLPTHDLWSVGLVIFYMLNAAQNPYDLNKEEIEDKRLDSPFARAVYVHAKRHYTRKYIKFALAVWMKNQRISFELYSLLWDLLIHGVDSCDEIITHPWFAGVLHHNADAQASMSRNPLFMSKMSRSSIPSSAVKVKNVKRDAALLSV